MDDSSMAPGQHVRVSFRAGPDDGVAGESMWVKVIEIFNNGQTIIGELDNEPICEGHGCQLGDRVVCTKVYYHDLEYYVFAFTDWRYEEEERSKEVQKSIEEARRLLKVLKKDD